MHHRNTLYLDSAEESDERPHTALAVVVVVWEVGTGDVAGGIRQDTDEATTPYNTTEMLRCSCVVGTNFRWGHRTNKGTCHCGGRSAMSRVGGVPSMTG